MDKKKIYFLYSCKEIEYAHIQDIRINYNKWLGLKEEKISCSFKISNKLNNVFCVILVCFKIDDDIYNSLQNNCYIQLLTDTSNYKYSPKNINNEINLNYNIDFFFQVKFKSEKKKDLPPPTQLNFSLYEEIEYLFFLKNNNPSFKDNLFLFALINYFNNYYENDLKLYFTMLGNIIETKNDKLLCHFFNYNFNYTNYLKSDINNFKKIKEIIEYLNTNYIFNILYQKQKNMKTYYYIIYGYLNNNDKQKALEFIKNFNKKLPRDLIEEFVTLDEDNMNFENINELFEYLEDMNLKLDNRINYLVKVKNKNELKETIINNYNILIPYLSFQLKRNYKYEYIDSNESLIDITFIFNYMEPNEIFDFLNTKDKKFHLI